MPIVPVKKGVLIIAMVLCFNYCQGQQTIDTKIKGNFSGSAKTEYIWVVKTKQGKGNPVEEGAADAYAIHCSNKIVKPLPAGCCEIKLVNEGDLNNDGKDEFSIFQAPVNGCTFSMATYSFQKNTWKMLIPRFLIPTACENFSEAEIQKRVFKQKGRVYYYETDANSEHLKLKKIEVLTK